MKAQTELELASSNWDKKVARRVWNKWMALYKDRKQQKLLTKMEKQQKADKHAKK